MCRSSERGLSLFLGALLLPERSEEPGLGVASQAVIHMGHGVPSESRERKQKYKFRRMCFIIQRQAVTGSAKYINKSINNK
jgi:hypothetical protein